MCLLLCLIVIRQKRLLAASSCWESPSRGATTTFVSYNQLCELTVCNYLCEHATNHLYVVQAHSNCLCELATTAYESSLQSLVWASKATFESSLKLLVWAHCNCRWELTKGWVPLCSSILSSCLKESESKRFTRSKVPYFSPILCWMFESALYQLCFPVWASFCPVWAVLPFPLCPVSTVFFAVCYRGVLPYATVCYAVLPNATVCHDMLRYAIVCHDVLRHAAEC